MNTKSCLLAAGAYFKSCNSKPIDLWFAIACDWSINQIWYHESRTVLQKVTKNRLKIESRNT